MADQHGEGDAKPCVYEDAASDLPLIGLAPIDLGRFLKPIPAKRWCWTHASWEPSTPPGEGNLS